MRRVLVWLAVLAFFAATAWADLPAMTPCAPPSNGTAWPIDPGTGAPTGGDPVHFHLAYIGVPPPLMWGACACTGSYADSSTFNTAIGVTPTTIVHFYEDELGRLWAKQTVIDVDPPQTDTWYRVTSP